MIHFDCHAHVYETATAVDGARYCPKTPAPMQDWLSHQSQCGLQGGVIVQVSFLGTDNSQMCAALSELDPSRFAGVGVVPLDVRDADLDSLMAAGVRGLRWNLVRGAEVPDLSAPATQTFLNKLRARGLHLELHLEGPRLAPLLPALAELGLDVVIDHFGLPSEADPMADPMLRALHSLSDSNTLHVKFAAAYRTPFDITPHAEELLAILGPDRVVWGSDWPHTQHEEHTSYRENAEVVKKWIKSSDTVAARRLYGIKVIR